jgi:hypothetical protein
MEVLGVLLVSIFALLLYFLPSVVAFNKDHENRWAIFWVNLIFGSSGAGWIVALIWAFKK